MSGSVFVFQAPGQGGGPFLHRGNLESRGVSIAADETTAKEIARKEWHVEARCADVASGVFNHVCEVARNGGARGVWCHHIDGRRIVATFYTWAEFEGLAAGQELPAETELHRSMLHQLAAAIKAN